MYRVIFICTDNVGRSLTAKYLYEDWLVRNNLDDVVVSSAGTHADSDISSFSMEHMGRLRELGVDASGYVRTQLTEELLREHDIAMVMDEEQRVWIKERFAVEVPLYNEIYKGESVSLLITSPGATRPIAERLVAMVDYIHESIPVLAEKIEMIRKDR